MKSRFTYVFFVLMSAGFITLQSCNKSEILKSPSTVTTNNSVLGKSSSTGGGNSGGGSINSGGATGGGNSGGGHNGGGGGTTAPASGLAPADTTTSQLPVESIITTGRWKVTSFVQGNDNLTAQFAPYIFTFNVDRSLVADNSGNLETGTWHNQEAIFYYGIPVYGSSSYGFTMTIGTGVPLISLNENYFISKKTLTTINIDSINPAENAHITLSKLAQ